MIKHHRELGTVYTIVTPLLPSPLISIFNRPKSELIGNSEVLPESSLTLVV
ncbi:hypothetical protein [Candidatus Nanosyncoccus alces]|uniref:hypothetical protein n=1 Tax=Candidatus Nanosyncoccus alces TaxID=2171997 RepID=UPI0013ED4340|nr:hypothetical protein [Candidatus Nanosyncoccus alces]